MEKVKILFGVILLVLTSAVSTWAQTGAIAGTVTDPEGAVVQGAEVSLRNLQSNATRTTMSGDTGAYSLTNLPVGLYEVTVKKSSFKMFRALQVQLTVAQTVTLNPRLAPGTVSEQIEVRADQLPEVDLESAQVSNLIDQREIKDLPLITRDPYSLVLLSPGTSQTNTRLGGFTVNGSRERNNNFLLDGVDNNDTSVPGQGTGALSINPDSAQEFRVITNNFNAEFGRNTGAIVDVVTKSGTNSFHGAAYEFGRWNGFGGARDWFNRAPDKQDPYVRNQFGYSIGGPIRKDKTFFFFNHEMQRFRTTLTNTVNVPTAAFKTGVFTYIDPAGNPVPVDLTPGGANNAAGLPLDTTMQQILALYPTPAQSSDGISGTVFYPSSSQQNSYQMVAKIDHHLTNTHSLSLRYGYNHFSDPNPFHDDILPGGLGGVGSKSINQGILAGLTSTLTQNLVNNFNFGWNHIYANFSCNGLDVLDSVTPLDRFGNGRDYNLDPFTSFGCLDLVSNSQFRKTGTTSYSDSLSWVHGSHTFKFGADFRTIGETGPNNFFSRRNVFLNSFTGGGVSLIQGVSNASDALENAATTLYGFVWEDLNGEFFDKNGTRQPTDAKLFRQHEYSWFGQDSWKMRRNLTLTLGLRYQLDGVPYEENANFSNLLSDPSTTFPVTLSIVGPGTGNQLYDTDYSNIEPRVGFSWDPWSDGKTAVRGGFGIFHDRVFGNLFGNARGNPPFEQDYFEFPFETLNNAFGSGAFPAVAPDTTPSATIPDGFGLQPVLFDTHFRNLSSNNWNFGIQRQLPGNNVVDLSYVGSKGSHIYRNIDGNPPDPTLVQQLVTFCSDPANSFGCTSADVSNINLYFGAEIGALPFNAVAHNALFQPAYQRSVGNSIYHAAQVKVTHRLSHGFQVEGSYTWAHGIDDAPDPIDPAAGNRTFPRNSRNLAQDRGNSDNDVRHIGVISYIWEPPLGKGKSYISNGVLGRIFEGMEFSGITSLQTGHPFEIRSRVDSQRTGITGWGDLVGDPFAPGTNDDPSVNQGNKVFFRNPDAFAEPPFGRAGNIGRNQFYGPSFVNFDLAFAKRTSLTERVGLELRIEGYNILNHPHFTNPGSDGLGNLLESGSLGLITSTVSRPDATTSARQTQAAIKVTF